MCTTYDICFCENTKNAANNPCDCFAVSCHVPCFHISLCVCECANVDIKFHAPCPKYTYKRDALKQRRFGVGSGCGTHLLGWVFCVVHQVKFMYARAHLSARVPLIELNGWIVKRVVTRAAGWMRALRSAGSRSIHCGLWRMGDNCEYIFSR